MSPSGLGRSTPGAAEYLNAPGEPDERTRRVLIEFLSRHGKPGQQIWFAYDQIATGMTGHPSTVLSGSFEEAERFRDGFFDKLSGGRVVGPSYWWTSKHTTGTSGPHPDEIELWTVGTDYDSYWTDIAGPARLIDELVIHPALETYLLS